MFLFVLTIVYSCLFDVLCAHFYFFISKKISKSQLIRLTHNKTVFVVAQMENNNSNVDNSTFSGNSTAANVARDLDTP